MFKDNLDRFFSNLEWRWSLANMLWGSGVILSAGLPAWAVRSMDLFAGYSPLSWVFAGLAGFAFFCIFFYVYAISRSRLIRARYDARALAKGSSANPMEKVFERKRIYLNEFVLPSSPLVWDKKFVDCEIIGPANIYIVSGNRIDRMLLPRCDAIAVRPDAEFWNCYRFGNCTFDGCSFQRVTFIVAAAEYGVFKDSDMLNWSSYVPDDDLPLLMEGEVSGSDT